MPTLPRVTPRRLAFQEGQILRAADLRGEQLYRIEGRRRHQHYAHSGGIVAGLVLQEYQTGITLGPGMALDGCGRELIVGSSRVLDANDLDAALKCVGPISKQANALDLWLGYNEIAPGEPDNPFAPAAAPRTIESYHILYTDPAQVDAVADDWVLVGSIQKNASKWTVLDYARAYVRATGSEVVAPSKRSRLLLAPQSPSDPRCFAVSTGSGQPSQFTDRFVVNADGDIRIAGNATLKSPDDKTRATCVVAHRRAVVLRTELVQPRGLLAQLRQHSSSDGIEKNLWQESLKEDERDRLSAVDTMAALSPRTILTLLRMLNQAITQANYQSLCQNNKRLRPETARLLQAAKAESPRGNDRERLCRLLLEDAFPDMIAKLPGGYDGPWGVAFADARPEPKKALPAQIYRTALKSKEATGQELRIEFEDPGKAADPAHYSCVFGVEGRRGEDDGQPMPFLPLLTIAANNTVTVTGNLIVPKHEGQLIQATPAADPADPISQIRLLGALTPANLKIVAKDLQEGAPATKAIRFKVQVWNTGMAPLQSVQINGSATDISSGASRGFAVVQGGSLPPTGDKPAEYTVDLTEFEVTGSKQVFLGLLLIGLGPANNILQATPFGQNLKLT